MPAEIRWTIRGRREMTRALNWIGRHHPDGVEPVANAIQSQLERLRWTPFLGTVFQRTPRGEIRETLAARYRIFYPGPAQRHGRPRPPGLSRRSKSPGLLKVRNGPPRSSRPPPPSLR